MTKDEEFLKKPGAIKSIIISSIIGAIILIIYTLIAVPILTGSLLGLTGGLFALIILNIIVMSLFYYFILKQVTPILSLNSYMEKVNYCILVFIGITLIDFILTLILTGKLGIPSTASLTHIAIVFIIPALLR